MDRNEGGTGQFASRAAFICARVTVRPPMPQPPSGTSLMCTNVWARTAGIPSASTQASVTFAIIVLFCSAESDPAGMEIWTNGNFNSYV